MNARSALYAASSCPALRPNCCRCRAPAARGCSVGNGCWLESRNFFDARGLLQGLTAARCAVATSPGAHPCARSLQSQTWEGTPMGCHWTTFGGGVRAKAEVAITRDGTRTRNLLLRREAPYPLGHTSSGSTANASRQIAVLRCVSNTGRRGRSCRCLPWKSACHLEEVQARRGAAAPRQHAPEAMIAWVRDGDAAARLRFSMAVAPLGLGN